MDFKKLAVLFLLFASIAAAQTPAPAQTPTVSPENHARIRDLQRQQDQMVITSLQMQKQQDDLQKRYNAINAQLEDAITKTLLDAKADPKDWSLDREALTFRAVPKPEQKPADLGKGVAPIPDAKKKKP